MMHLLVGLDESPWSLAAQQTAVDIAVRAPEQVRLTGLHVVSVRHPTGDVIADLAGLLGFEPVMVPEKVEAVYQARGERFLESFRARCSEVSVECGGILDQGAQLARLAHHAASVDLVVLGARGETEVAWRGQGGSKVEKLIRSAPADVLVVPRTVRPIEAITVGFDGTEGARRALRSARKLARLLQCPLHLCYVEDGRRAADFDPIPEALAALLADGVEATGERIPGEPHETLVARCIERGDGLLAVGRRGRSWFTDLILGRVTERILGKAELSLLVAR
jgi:nucleotide-binding universal stress UspA family protein